jgi:23S rRNA (cytosine1962-C5)-methyltransferase
MQRDPFDLSSRRRLILKKGRERAGASRHPWIFSGAIASDDGPADAAFGDLFQSDGRPIGSGFYSAHSQIRLRLVTLHPEELTAGTVEQRIREAVERRRSLALDGTDAFRLIHAEGDGIPGLIADRYGDVVVVEITSAGADAIRDTLVTALRGAVRETFAQEPSGMILRNDIPARKLEQLSLRDEVIGDVPPVVEIAESTLRFRVDPHGGQKTGFFLDQRENRIRARAIAGSRRVLNLFAYSGGFGVHAAAGGATEVTEVDSSEQALALARENHQLNGSAEIARFVGADVFGWTRGAKAAREKWDLIVCDPPAFARGRGDVERAARAYKDVNLQVLALAAPGADVMTFSCSGHIGLDLFQKIVYSAALDAGRRVSFVSRLTAGRDHPVSIHAPEGEYLKGFLLAVHD